jgi:hypothetical protein
MATTTDRPPSQPASPPVVKATKAGKPGPVRRALNALASLRLTVVLFAFAIALVFAGTLAQIDDGIWTVVGTYFRTAYVWIPFKVFFPRSWHVPGGIPYPGGWLIGGLLLVNLLAAHLDRFKLSWKRSGILLIHAGLVVMMISEFITGKFAVEGNMTILQQGSSNFLEHHTKTELAVVDRSSPGTDDVVVIPERFLRQGGLIQHPELPFDVEVVQFMTNSSMPTEPKPGVSNPATAGDGLNLVTTEQPEVSGTQEQKVDLSSAYVTFKKKNGEPLGTYLLSLWFSALSDRPNQQVSVDGKTYDVTLRWKRTYKPYTVHLEEFRHDLYPGTNTPKNFSSRIHLADPDQGVDREVTIRMNEPLSYRGETFYQTSFLPGDRGSVLQVVRNPGWVLPYLSCAMVSFGMLIHFGLHLISFLSRRVPA